MSQTQQNDKTRFELIKEMSAEDLAIYIAALYTHEINPKFRYFCSNPSLHMCFKCAKDDKKDNCFLAWLKETDPAEFKKRLQQDKI